jgi:HSP20 family protein
MNTVAQKENRPVAERRAQETVCPDVDIFEGKDEYILQAEMPGVGKDGLELTLENNELRIRGRRSVEEIKADVVYRESRPADYVRVFELDPTIETSKISAKMEQGLLTLRLPKAEKVKPRKIAIE